ncbi:MAG: 3-hydroxyacyl-ACP dehydratase FabZ [Gammaproteobacteria bacterium]|nr:3-hydroxyacyl-ACP dehydratase FabZ [Gammaproteobacteria bacterium]
MDIQAIMEHLPHRYPFLLIDRIVQCDPGKSLTAIKNVTINEPHFQGHFPQLPVMPGVLILEAMAQATGVLAFQTRNGRQNIYYLVGIDSARFKRPVVPGDQLVIEVEFKQAVRNIWKVDARAKVDGKIVASAELMCAEKE